MRARARMVAHALGSALLPAILAATALPALAAGPLDTGIALYRRGDLPAAERAFRRAVAAAPRSHPARLWLGATLYRLDRHSDAATVFRGALSLAPKDSRTWLWWGYALARSGDRARARQALERALLLAPRGGAAELAAEGLRAMRPPPTPVAHSAVLRPDTYRDLARFYNPRLSLTEAHRIGEAILGYSAREQLDPRLVVSLIVVESGFAPGARSHKGAMGLGQLMPATAASLGVANAYDPVQNVYGTVRVLRGNLDRFGWENLHLALAAYNAGKGAVLRYGGIPPYQETQWYVYNVSSLYRRLLEIYRIPAHPSAQP